MSKKFQRPVQARLEPWYRPVSWASLSTQVKQAKERHRRRRFYVVPLVVLIILKRYAEGKAVSDGKQK